MKSVIASAVALLASAAAVSAGDYPITYASTPFKDSIYNGTQYNETVINGVTYNASNLWPGLTAKDYESIIPSCSLQCISQSLAADSCDVDDFSCHCTQSQSEIIDAAVVPCLTTGPLALCTGPEIGQLANFVHGSLCPYFIDTPKDVAYPPKSTSTSSWSTSSTSSADEWDWSTSTSSSSSSSAYWTKATSSSAAAWVKPSCKTSTSTTTTSTEKWCPEPTTLTWGTTSWVVSEATTVTISDWPVTYTWTVTESSFATSTAAAWAVSASPASSGAWAAGAAAGAASSSGWAAGAAAGTAAWSASPAQFTGAAANNKVAGALVAGAAAAAAMLI